MVCRLASAKPISEPIQKYFNCAFRNNLQWNLNQNAYIFIPEKAFENVAWKKAAILAILDIW